MPAQKNAQHRPPAEFVRAEFRSRRVAPRQIVAQSSKMTAYKNLSASMSASPRLRRKSAPLSAEQSDSPRPRTAPQSPAKSACACDGRAVRTPSAKSADSPPRRTAPAQHKQRKTQKQMRQRRKKGGFFRLRRKIKNKNGHARRFGGLPDLPKSASLSTVRRQARPPATARRLFLCLPLASVFMPATRAIFFAPFFFPQSGKQVLRGF